MDLEKGRDLVRGSMILVCAGIAYWVDLSIGLALIALMGVMIVQSVLTGWCPADLILKPLGLRSRPRNAGIKEPQVKRG